MNKSWSGETNHNEMQLPCIDQASQFNDTAAMEEPAEYQHSHWHKQNFKQECPLMDMCSRRLRKTAVKQTNKIHCKAVAV